METKFLNIFKTFNPFTINIDTLNLTPTVYIYSYIPHTYCIDNRTMKIVCLRWCHRACNVRDF